MSKKYALFLTFLVFSASFWGVSANGGTCEAQCNIYNETPEVMLDYVQDLRTAVRNITTKISKETPQSGVKKDFWKVKTKITRWYNLVSNWSGYFSYFKFYVTYPTTHEYIPEIWRDYEILNNESNGLERYIKSLWNRWYQEISLSKDEVCAWIVSNCDFSGNALDVLIQISANHEKVKEYYRLSIMGDSYTKPEWGIAFTRDNFYTDFQKYYNENTTANCSLCDWGYWNRVSEAKDRISQNMEAWKSGIQEWQAAWALLIGGWDAAQNQKIERDLLRRELGRQWVSSEQSQRVLNNLDTFNENGLSKMMSNNFISNSFDYIIKTITPQVNDFKESLNDTFRDEEGAPKTQVSIADLNANYSSTTDATAIKQSIDMLYQKELPTLAVYGENVDEVISKLMEMHFDLNKSIEYLERAKKLFTQACKYQADGRGKCE